ncbi:uncharacterized protein L3040_003946 [Drepanopeziza brunnea f. sp. 'multigermtubi']|uniref:Iron-sulfur cluster assembly accessory protein n=1 Tax=Marssonina brunnea f. sp. multigermtubi (strain MB_m1) TaxID=1072389 RepID=K1WBT7_MARBU|nr:iron-sulfur cluster assembly accessory protein [Drepanopeziza brunnea f. sp. 'multigermtubi' MB_m1]EKD14835.1 iron-sulfur cluster assembly accessory protein [Drepanopeziza brunnea f. sp. 'multigermtubi' MB_m1]KAJ5046714.1 hypothetical protein L3040_003946 [Drepanopeziza brunnea f. sp. 'multigermtubi']
MASRSVARSCSQLANSAPSSAARAFLQLAPLRSFYNAPPVLDFLAPSIPFPALQSNRTADYTSARRQIDAKRSFTSSSRQQATRAIYNPRNDDDGAPMDVEITPRASNRLREIMAKDANPHLALRIQVESGGCHGFQYLMSLTTLPALPSSPTNTTSATPQLESEASPALNTSSSDPNAMPSLAPSSPPLPEEGKKGTLYEDDTVFAADDGSDAKVVMDGPSLELLKGSKIDYTMELIGSQFKIVDNPLATSSCGCGTSFDIKA